MFIIGRMTFEFIYPAEKCCPNILFYSAAQLSEFNSRSSNCWQKETPLRPDEDILRLTPRFSWSGCHVTYQGGVRTYVCKGGRSFTVEGQRRHHGHGLVSDWSDSAAPAASWYIAVSNCASLRGLELQYRIEVSSCFFSIYLFICCF